MARGSGPGQKCGNKAPKTVKISNFGHKFAPQGSLACPILRNSQLWTRLQVDLKFLTGLLSGDIRDKQPSYKHFPAVGAFFFKFSIAASGETSDQIKKKVGMQKTGRASSVTMPIMVGILGRAPSM